MRISETLLKSLAERGIIVRPHLESDEKWLEMKREESYKWLAPYYSESCYNGELVGLNAEEREAHRRRAADERADRMFKYRWENKEMYIFFDGLTIQCKNVGVFKEIDEDFIMKKIEREKKKYAGAYGNFARTMQNLLKRELQTDVLGFNIYPTTYGIGVWFFYNFGFEKDVERVTQIMDKYGVEYSNEFSDKRWAYRFKISKTKENLEKIGA